MGGREGEVCRVEVWGQWVFLGCLLVRGGEGERCRM